MEKETKTIRISKDAENILKHFGNFGDNWNNCIINLYSKYMLKCKQFEQYTQMKQEKQPKHGKQKSHD